MQPVYCAT